MLPGTGGQSFEGLCNALPLVVTAYNLTFFRNQREPGSINEIKNDLARFRAQRTYGGI
jgi:hypothetical protein